MQDREALHLGNESEEMEICDAEILDELTTSRGELKVRTTYSGEDKRIQVRMRINFVPQQLYFQSYGHCHCDIPLKVLNLCPQPRMLQ